MSGEKLQSIAELKNELMALGHAELAEKLLRQHLVNSPEDEAMRKALVEVLIYREQVAQIATVLDQCAPTSTGELRLSAIDLFYRLGRKDLIWAQLKHLATYPPRSPDGQLRLADGFAAVGDVAAAERWCAPQTTDEKSPLWPRAVQQLANLRNLQNRYREADELFERLARAQPRLQDVYRSWSWCLLARGELERGIALCESGYAVIPDLKLDCPRMSVYLLSKKRIDLAERLLRAALRGNSDDAECHFSLGNVLADRGLLGEAELQLRAALRTKPNSVVILVKLATILKSQRRLPEAITYAQTAAQIDPEADTPHTALAQIYMVDLKSEEAAKEFALADSLRQNSGRRRR
jgi:tetratricopeptide (TPR) repeat protein